MQSFKNGSQVGGHMEDFDVLSSWEEMKIEHIRNAINAQRGVMLEITEKHVSQFQHVM